MVANNETPAERGGVCRRFFKRHDVLGVLIEGVINCLLKAMGRCAYVLK